MVSENYLKQDKLTAYPLRFDHYEYVIEHMRQWDHMEVMLQGYTKKQLLKMFDNLQGVSATHEDIPVLCAGYQTFPNVYWYWFIATPLVRDFFKNITREAKKMITKNQKTNPQARHIVQVWNKHQDSVKWLNILKFKPFSSFSVGNEEILLMEMNRT